MTDTQKLSFLEPKDRTLKDWAHVTKMRARRLYSLIDLDVPLPVIESNYNLLQEALEGVRLKLSEQLIEQEKSDESRKLDS